MWISKEHDKIIVFRHYGTAIDGNLAKTKLDAHGIPCFLTEENLSTLYPGQGLQLFGVRLHLFNNDAELANEILNDQIAPDYVCPKCGSQKVEIEQSKKFVPALTSLLYFLSTIWPLTVQKVYRCQDCEFEF